MKYVACFLIAVSASSILLQPAAFAAYGGGWGSSVNATSLTRDLCPDGDKSNSYYDWTCGSETKKHEVAPALDNKEKQETSAVELASPSDTYMKEGMSLEEWIIKKKQELTQKWNDTEKKTIDMPVKYLVVQKKVDSLLSRWDNLSTEKKDAKIKVLVKKIDTLLTSTKLTPRLRMVIEYIQNKSILMSSYTN